MLRLGDGGLVGLYPALVYAFEERGIASGIEPGIEWVFGDRVLTEPASTVWFVCDTGTVFSLLADELGAQVVSSITPFDEIDEVTVRDLQVRLANQLRKVGHEEFLSSLESPLVSFALQGIDVDQDLVVELAEYNAFTPEPGFRFGVVAFPADAVPELWWSLNAVS